MYKVISLTQFDQGFIQVESITTAAGKNIVGITLPQNIPEDILKQVIIEFFKLTPEGQKIDEKDIPCWERVYNSLKPLLALGEVKVSSKERTSSCKEAVLWRDGSGDLNNEVKTRLYLSTTHKKIIIAILPGNLDAAKIRSSEMLPTDLAELGLERCAITPHNALLALLDYANKNPTNYKYKDYTIEIYFNRDLFKGSSVSNNGGLFTLSVFEDTETYFKAVERVVCSLKEAKFNITFTSDFKTHPSKDTQPIPIASK
jgi:hypothetical protein